MFPAADKRLISIPPPEGLRERDVPMRRANPTSHAGASSAAEGSYFQSLAQRAPPISSNKAGKQRQAGFTIQTYLEIITLINLVLEEGKCFSVLPSVRRFVECLTWSPSS